LVEKSRNRFLCFQYHASRLPCRAAKHTCVTVSHLAHIKTKLDSWLVKLAPRERSLSMRVHTLKGVVSLFVVMYVQPKVDWLSFANLLPAHTFSGPPDSWYDLQVVLSSRLCCAQNALSFCNLDYAKVHTLQVFKKCIPCPLGHLTPAATTFRDIRLDSVRVVHLTANNHVSQERSVCLDWSLALHVHCIITSQLLDSSGESKSLSRCNQCSNHTATSSEGQSAESACEPVDCAAKQCENKAECVVRDHRAVCECRPGFVGERCELIEPVCDSSPCFNGGSCEEIAGTFRCICPQNFTGSRCQFGMDECIGVSCPNGGVCHDLPGFGTTKCLCRTGFAGPECKEIEDICSSANPCRNGADCIPSQLGRFKCKCLPGWEGTTCEVQYRFICTLRKVNTK
ncbi:EGF-like domain protein, partial [Cooperia oncophora]